MPLFCYFNQNYITKLCIFNIEKSGGRRPLLTAKKERKKHK